MDNVAYDKIVSHLLNMIPEYRDDYDELSNFYEDATGVHLVFGDFTRFVMKLIESGGSHEQLFQRIFTFIEQAAQSDDVRTREVIQVSFLENLGKDPSCLNIARKYMKPSTQKLLKGIEDFWGKVAES